VKPNVHEDDASHSNAPSVTPPLRLVPAERQATLDDDRAMRSIVIHAARGGDVRAFASLVDMYYGRCLRFALNMLGSRLDAEEAVQDAFVRLYRALPRYREEESFEPWLFRILANRCRTAGAKERRHAMLMDYGDVPDHPSGDRHDAAIAWREEIGRALAAIPVEQREAFLMRHVEGLSYDDMAVATGLGVSALKMRVKRACDALKMRLTEVESD
jgi:RNA polymerase sigma-70 factor (ECF subfamily)